MEAINPLLLFALGAAASMVIIPLVWKVAPQVGLLDLPDPRKVHRVPVPRVGGWGITIGTLVPLILSFQLDPILQSFVLGALTLFVFGVWDDVKELGHWTKFAGQFIAVGIVVWHGDLYVTRLPFLDTVTMEPWSGRLFTAFALVGAINASNHSDGLDGLAGGEALLSLIGMAALAYVVGDALVVAIALAAIGGILGFLRYNSHPARVFMGDSGSQVLGFTLGFVAVYLTQVAHTALSAALPLLLLGVPIADILVVLYLRVRGGRNWFSATRNHLHHRLLDLNLGHFATVIVIYSIHGLLVVSAVLLRYESDWLVFLVYLAIIGTVFGAVSIAERRRLGHERHERLGPPVQLMPIVWRSRATRVLLVCVSGLVPGLVVVGAATVAAVPRDFALAAGALAVVVVAELARTRGAGSALTRGATYTAAIFTAYLLAFYPGTSSMQATTLGVVIVLSAAVAGYMRTATRQEFGTTPTDYLVVFGVLALVAFGSIAEQSRAAVSFVACAAVLLYGCEIVIGRRGHGALVLSAATLVALGVIAVRGAL